jgi:DNA-binding response OmpR family regulator
MKVLLVEDHDELRRMTAAHLSERGFVVDAVDTVAGARAALGTSDYDAMVLDMGLPDGDGAMLLVGGSGRPPPPALMLTARDRVEDRITGLNAGADDYMVKPFDLSELEARLRAILRRPGRRAPVALTLGRLRFDTPSHEAFLDETPLNLGRREALLLEVLLSAAGRIVVRDILSDRLYGFNEPVTPNALDAAVSRLRRSLDRAGAGVVLETRRGIGYRLRAAP